MIKVNGTTGPLTTLIIGLEKIITILNHSCLLLSLVFFRNIKIFRNILKWRVTVSSAFRIKEFWIILVSKDIFASFGDMLL